MYELKIGGRLDRLNSDLSNQLDYGLLFYLIIININHIVTTFMFTSRLLGFYYFLPIYSLVRK